MDGTVTTISAFALTLLLTLGLTPVARQVALALRIVDSPDGVRKLQRAPVPLLGGLAVFVSLVIGMFILPEDPRWQPLPITLGLAIVFVVGVYDDSRNLRARWKLTGQVIATLPVVFGGYVVERVGLGGFTFELGFMSVPLTMLWMVVCINSMNLLDGMDGLAATVGLCIAGGVGLLAALNGSSQMVLPAMLLAGALAGFLRYNFPPAKIYLGDAGSMVIGLALAVFAMEAATDGSGRSSATVMTVLMGLPIGDTLLAIVRRSLSGNGVCVADRGHIHHRLLERGFTAAAALVIVASICSLSGLFAVASRVWGWQFGLLAMATLAVALLRARLVGNHEWSLARNIFLKLFVTEPFGLPRGESLGELTFEEIWSRSVAAVHSVWLGRLQLTVHQAGQPIQVHGSWLAPEELDAVAFEITAGSLQSTLCHLRIETIDGGRLIDSRSLIVLSALRQIIQYWAQHPETMPDTGLRIFGDTHSFVLPQPETSKKLAA